MTVICRFRAKKGQGPALVNVISRAVASYTRPATGCNGVDMYTNRELPEDFIVVERWASHESYDAYMKTFRGTGTVEAANELIAEVSIGQYDSVA